MNFKKQRKNKGPLSDMKILDCTQVMAGPFCTMLLADMGATVVKIENPDGGDDTRGWPPFYEGGESSYFQSVNRNKKSLTLDLKSDEGKKILTELIKQSDVLIQNFRPGAIERLGFGWDICKEINPEYPVKLYN